MAEAVLRKEGFEATSAGFRKGGLLAAKKTREWAAKNGYDISHHRSKHLIQQFCTWADVILCMNETHKFRLISLYPEMEKKIKLLGEYDRKKTSIPDPGFLHPDSEEFKSALRRVVNCCKNFAKENTI